MSKSRLAAALFDVDGTLVDSNDLHATAWVEAFRHFGFDLPFDRVRGQIGKGGDNLIPALLPTLPAARREEMESWRGDLFKRVYLDQVRPFPGVRALFTRIREDGIAIVLASSAKQEEVDHHVRLLECGDLISATTTADEVESSKPDPDIFAVALRSAGVDADRAIVVGDTPYDVEAAAKIGLRTIGFRCGGFDEDALRQAGAVTLFDGPEDMLARYPDSPLA